MQRLEIQRFCVAAVAAAILSVGNSVSVRADGPFLHISGGGTGAFDAGEELERFTTQFAVGVVISDIYVENDCDEALDGLGVGDFTVTDGDGFTAANGEFNCSLMIKGDGGGFVVILGDVLQARVNENESITLCGLADIPIDTFSGLQFFDCPFAVTFRADGSGFTYYDVVTGPDGDAETCINGAVLIH